MIVHPRSVFTRETDALQAARGIICNVIVAFVVIWGAIGLILWWALP